MMFFIFPKSKRRLSCFTISRASNISRPWHNILRLVASVLTCLIAVYTTLSHFLGSFLYIFLDKFTNNSWFSVFSLYPLNSKSYSNSLHISANVSMFGKDLCFKQNSSIYNTFLKSRSEIVLSRLVYCPDRFDLLILMSPFLITSKLLMNKSSNKILSEFGIKTKLPQKRCRKYYAWLFSCDN